MGYGGKTLFSQVSLQFTAPNRYGLTGANGAGKSTFLRVLCKEEEAESGSVQISAKARLGFLKQDQDMYREQAVLDVTISGNQVLWQAMQEKQKLLAKENATEDSKKLAHWLAHWEEVIYAQKGYSAAASAAELLSGLGLSQKMIAGNMNELSGGYRLRVLLAKVLFSNPDILLLDEPTNHLDIISIAWLEKFLVEQFKGVLVVISHDRSFLNNVCNSIADVDFNTITLYKGNYDKFLAARDLALEQKLKEIENQEKKMAQTQAFIDRFKAKASKARQAQSRAKQIEKIELPQIIKSSRRYPEINFSIRRPSGKRVLKVSHLNKSFGEKKVLHNIDFEIFRSQRVAVIGENGAGKSTLLKILAKELQTDSGEIIEGHETTFSYFAQDYAKLLNSNKTAFNWLYEKDAELGMSKIRAILGALLFSQDEAEKKLKQLSGGEGARLLIASLIVAKANVLILDEPTNHLDMESVEELKRALLAFEGTVIFVSHDRNFVQEVADTIFSLSVNADTNEQSAFINFQGNYNEYLEKHGNDWLQVSGQNTLQKQKTNALAKNNGEDDLQNKPVNDYQKRKELKSLQQKLTKAIQRKELNIQEIEKRIKEITDIFAEGSIFAENSQKANLLDEEKNDLEKKLEISFSEWEDLQKQLEEIKQQKA